MLHLLCRYFQASFVYNFRNTTVRLRYIFVFWILRNAAFFTCLLNSQFICKTMSVAMRCLSNICDVSIKFHSRQFF